MNKLDFCNELSNKISFFPAEEQKRTIDYYNEIIVDRMEDGMSEEEAIQALGNIDDIVNTIVSDTSFAKLMKAKVDVSKEKAGNKALWTTLVIIGSPVWFPLAIAFAGILFSLYVVVWCLIFTLYCVLFSFAITGLAGILGGFVCFATGSPLSGIALLGMAALGAGITLFLWHPCVLITKLIIMQTKKFFQMIKIKIARKGNINE